MTIFVNISDSSLIGRFRMFEVDHVHWNRTGNVK
jgi:hypothetical protein